MSVLNKMNIEILKKEFPGLYHIVCGASFMCIPISSLMKLKDCMTDKEIAAFDELMNILMSVAYQEWKSKNV